MKKRIWVKGFRCSRCLQEPKKTLEGSPHGIKSRLRDLTWAANLLMDDTPHDPARLDFGFHGTTVHLRLCGWGPLNTRGVPVCMRPFQNPSGMFAGLVSLSISRLVFVC